MKNNYVFIALILVILAGTYFGCKYTNSPNVIPEANNQVAPETNTIPENWIYGVIRTHGLDDTTLEEMGLKGFDYQLTDLNDKILVIDSQEFNGLYLNSGAGIADYIGKCVALTYTLDSSYTKFTTKDRTVNGLYTYNRIPAAIDHIKMAAYSECTYLNNKPGSTNMPLELSGTIERMTRPAPDIGYDYIIRLDNPVEDNLNASGSPQMFSSYIVVPETIEISNIVENSINKHVVAKGRIEWGYSESTHYVVSFIEVK